MSEAQQLDDGPLLLFDGECGLCHRAVQFVLRRDPRARFRFAALQSQAAARALQAVGHDAPLPDSLVVVADGRVRVRSTAALFVARGLRWPWPLLAIFWLVPYPLRDLVYDWIARNRHRWFPPPEGCFVPSPALRARFADRDERAP